MFLNDEWYRLDARGNREGIDAQFSIDEEKLAFSVSQSGETNYPEIYSKPLDAVIIVFDGVKTVDELMKKIPDGLID